LKDGSVDVVDMAAGSVGGLNVPGGYESSDSPSAGIEQLIFSRQGPLAAPAARRALAQCTPRDSIARDAGTQVANVRLSTVSDDAFSAAESAAANNQYMTANATAAKGTLNNAPLTVRIGYQGPNARLASAVSAGPQALTGNQIDALLAGTGGATGGGSSGSSAIDGYDLHTGNGNNLAGYSNPQIDGIIENLAVTSDAKDIAKLLGDSTGPLWNDMPTLPLYRQQRTLITSKKMSAATSNPTRWGAGWNMDRWVLRE